MAARSRVHDLRTALDSGEVLPYFQPIIDLKTRQVTGFEVLARRKHPKKGASLPPDMIRLAETFGLIGRITESLVVQTAALARTLPSHLRYSINISPSQFCEPNFPETFCALKHSVGLPAEQVTLEITESALLDDFEQALANSLRLKALGIRLALDDFGTGYSSLRHLQALPFDEIKVDSSFVKSMAESRPSRKIVAAIVGLSHSLGLTTVAEGIESDKHAEMLFYLGCGEGQGWLYSPAIPAESVPDYLATQSMVQPVHPPSAVGNSIGTTLEVFPAQRLSQLQAIYEGAPVGLAFLDRNLRYISINKHFADAHDVPVESHLGRTVAEVLPEIYPSIALHLQRALDGKTVNGIEVTMTYPEHPGRIRVFLATYQPARDEADEVIGISVAAVDITERKNAEIALRASIEHYWRGTGYSVQMPWTAGPDGEMLDISPRWELVTGLSYEQVIQGEWVKALHPDDRERVIEWYGKSIRTAEPLDMLFRIVRPDGETLWIRSCAAPRIGPDGKVIRWYGTLEEIDARRKSTDPVGM